VNSDDLLDMAGDPRFISGIYNYCDRWCERCAFTDRCLTFASSREMERRFELGMGDDEADFDGDELVDELTVALQDTVDLLHTIAEEEGVDLDSDFAEMEATMARDEQVRRSAAEHPLTMAADVYVGLVNDWFGVGQRQHTSDRDVLAELPASSDPAPVIDALEVIRWFQFMISVKIRRALGSRAHEAENPEFWTEVPKDSDGTAKIALIAIDRSIGAWGALLPAFSLRQSATLEMLALLSRLRIELEQEFPDAWAFVRPGFDEQ
jgi:hypothetical protein